MSSERGGTGPQQPSQAEGSREVVEADLREKFGEDTVEAPQPTQPTGSETPSARDPLQRPSQAEGER